jgi:hypothetical protein
MILAVSSPTALAATGETADSSGGQPAPQPASTAETGWNPHPSCMVPAYGESIYDLLRCLGAGIDGTFMCVPDPGSSPLGPDLPEPIDPCPYSREDYYVTFLEPPKIGIKIVRVDGSEPDSLYLRENDPSIQWTTVSVNRRHLVARIAPITETPSIGAVSVYLNTDPTPVTVTTDGMTADDVNNALMALMGHRGWSFYEEESYIVILSGPGGIDVRRVSFRSTDPAIVNSELRIEPLFLDDAIQLPPPNGLP